MGIPETVKLRPRTPEDFDTLYRIASDLNTWEERSPLPPFPLTREQYEASIGAPTDSSADADRVSFVIDVGGQPAGFASLFDFDPLARHAEAGIALVPESRGRGIGTLAINELVAFGFVRRNLRRIHLQLIESNLGALRAYQNAGFVVEGRQREHAWVRGNYEDIIRMGLLRSEWAAAGGPEAAEPATPG